MAKFLRHIILLVALLPWAGFLSVAQSFDGEVFRSLTLSDGLAGESVARILPSSDGRVYLATSSGVSLYDGTRILNFPLNSSAPEQPNYVYDLCEDSEGGIYAATTLGLFFRRRSDEDFSQIYPGIKRAECVLCLGGVLYVGNRDGFHICSDGGIRTVTVGASRMGVENGVRDIIADPDGNIRFLSRYALNCYSPSDGSVTSRVLTDRMPKGAALNRLVLCGDKFYVGTKNNGLYTCSLSGENVTEVGGVGNVVTTLGLTADGDVTVSCDGAGAFILDGESGRILERFNSKADSAHRLPSDAVYCFTKDERGVCYLGFYRNGMCHSYYCSPVFRCYSFDSFSTSSLPVRSFYIGDGVKLIGTGDGLYCIDERKHSVRLIPPSSLGGSHIITAITQFAGSYYIATYDAGLHRVDPRDFSVSRVGGEPLLSTTSVSCFAQSPSGTLWVGTGEGIFVLDEKGCCIRRFTENNSRIGGGMVSGMLFDSGGNCWVSSQSLSIYVAKTGIFENSNFPEGFFNREGGLGCVSGHDGLLYFTRQTKIYYTDPAMSRFGRLELPEELRGGTCYGFLDDGKGSFWIATSDGLFRTPYSLDSFQHFGYGEGMQCRYINSGGVRMDTQGNIWAGTSDGLMELDPVELERWQRDSTRKVELGELRLEGDILPVSSEDGINSGREIRLGWNLTSERLSFRFILRDYARSGDRIYQYRFLDKPLWRSVREGEDVTLERLSPGKHSFSVRLAGAPGTENTYEILVLPSAGAVLELVFLLAAICLLIMWHRYHRDTRVLLRERGEIESALMEAERESEALREKEEQEGEEEKEKYSRVKLDEMECADVVSRMKEYISTSRCYRNPELKMSDIAAVLGLSSSRLSQIFSLYLKENYYEFINRYRLEEYKRLLSDEENRRKYTLTALSEQCGFRKSNFYSTFRRVEGMTPAEYLKKHNIKV